MNQRVALAEIRDVLPAVCVAHELPLALTWIPCSYSEDSSDQTITIRTRGYDSNDTSLNERYVLCIEDTACYVNDKGMQSFVHASAEHYLEKGKGIAGKALESNQPFFHHDVKKFHVNEFPLVHHARKAGLGAAIAIRLRSSHTFDDEYILEFFLPVTLKESKQQQLLINNLYASMRRLCKSFRIVSDAENLQPIAGTHKQMEKMPSTPEKHISLDVLQQYFTGTIKDAAKSLDVSPTTLKKICRQHGISRWPSRKIKKANRSLRKTQSILDSIEGLEEGLKYDLTKQALFPDMDPLVSSSSSGIQNFKSAPVLSCTDNATTTVEIQDRVAGNQVAGANWIISPNFPESSFLPREGCREWVLCIVVWFD